MNLIGYIVEEATADSVLAAIDSAFDNREMPRYWTIGKFAIHQGEHAGKFFLPASDDVLDAPLIGTPPSTPRDFPEFSVLIAMLGGLEARQTIDSSVLSPPEP
jgi:hypothetical protein